MSRIVDLHHHAIPSFQLTNAGGSYLGDCRFDCVFAELQRRAAVVFVHPTASPDPIAHTRGRGGEAWSDLRFGQTHVMCPHQGTAILRRRRWNQRIAGFR